MATHWGYLSEVDNYMTTATTTASTTNSAYPVANVSAMPVAKTHRFTGKTSENYQIDLGSAKAVNAIVLVNHNLSSGATITVNAGAAANPNGSTYTTSMSYRQFDAYVLIAAQTYRYWKIIIADTGNSNAYIEVGYVMLGALSTAAFQFRYGWHQEDDFMNLERETVFGISPAEEMYRRTKITLPFGPLNSANFTTLRNLYIQQRRNVYGIWVMPVASNSADGYFGRFTSQLDRQVEYYSSTSLTFMEDSRGRSITA